jgi:hypothetical protein
MKNASAIHAAPAAGGRQEIYSISMRLIVNMIKSVRVDRKQKKRREHYARAALGTNGALTGIY